MSEGDWSEIRCPHGVIGAEDCSQCRREAGSIIGDSEYLGDGVYARNEGTMIALSTQRDETWIFIYLEPAVFTALLHFAIKIGWLKP